MLTWAEIDERLKALPPFEGGTPDEWAEMGMSAERCSCGRWLQIVRPDKYQCACELPEVRDQDREREALETALRLGELLESITLYASAMSCGGSDCPEDQTCDDNDPPCVIAIEQAQLWLRKR